MAWIFVLAIAAQETTPSEIFPLEFRKEDPALAAELRPLLSSFGAELIQVLSPKKPVPLKVRVECCSKHYDSAGGKRGTLATYVSAEKRVVAMKGSGLTAELSAALVRGVLEETAPVLNLGKPGTTWLWEGLQEYFTAAEIKGSSVRFDDPLSPGVSSRVCTLRRMFRDRKAIPLKKLVELTSKDYQPPIHNSQSWSLVYYLRRTQPVGCIGAMIQTIESGKPCPTSVSAGGKRIDIGALQNAYLDFYRKLNADPGNREEGDWVVGETEHYVLRVQRGTANVRTKATAPQILDELKEKMERMFEKYVLAFRHDGRLGQKAQVRIFKDKVGFKAAGAPEGAAAYYRSSTKELIGYEDSVESGMLFNLLHHEGCHQFFDLVFPGTLTGPNIPMWFSEGLADCFGSCEAKGEELYVFTLNGLAAWRVARVKDATQRREFPHLKDLMDLDSPGFMNPDRMKTNYAVAWSFCHFLWNYPDLTGGNGIYKETVVKMIEGMKEGRERKDLVREAFVRKGEPLDPAVLEKQWLEYVKKLKVLHTGKQP